MVLWQIRKQKNTLQQNKCLIQILQTKINLIKCPACPEKTLPHRACSSCGHYRGRYIGVINKVNPTSNEVES